MIYAEAAFFADESGRYAHVQHIADYEEVCRLGQRLAASRAAIRSRPARQARASSSPNGYREQYPPRWPLAYR